jgi:hypothetical protein
MATPRPTLRPRAAELLVAVASGGALEGLLATLTAADWADVREGLLYHRLAAYANVRLAGLAAVPGEVRDELTAAGARAMGHHLKTVADLRRLAGALDDLPWVTFKGPVVAATLYARPDMRVYGDLDVLVDPAHFGEAVERLEDASFVLYDANWPMLRREMLGEVHLVAPGGTLVDFHWHLVNIRRERERVALSTAAALARRRDVVVSGGTVPTLSAEDTLVHLCWHAAAGGGDRLGWLLDIAAALAAPGLDPDVLARRAVETRTRRAVAVMLSRARLVGADVPRPILRRLVPSGLFLTVDAAARRLHPIPRVLGSRSAPAHVATYALDAGAAAAGEFAALAWRRMWRAEVPLPQETVGDRVGGAPERAAYMEAVRAAAPPAAVIGEPAQR